MLKPDDFPLISIGALIYSRCQSSPVLTAMNDQSATEVTAWLNDYARIKAEVAQHGPTLVTYPA